MPAFSPDIWWAFIIGTLVLMILGFGLVGSIFIYQRRLISAQREKMEAIRKRERQYSDLFNNVTDLVFIHSMEGTLLQVNAVLTKFLGFEKNELLGKNLAEVIEPKYQNTIIQIL